MLTAGGGGLGAGAGAGGGGRGAGDWGGGRGGGRGRRGSRCKRKVVALKRLTIHEAPSVLTVHLKRFDPVNFAMGGKIGT